MQQQNMQTCKQTRKIYYELEIDEEVDQWNEERVFIHFIYITIYVIIYSFITNGEHVPPIAS